MSNDTIENMILPFKLQQLLGMIIQKRGLGIEDALQYLYSSDLYEQMSREESYLWQLSTLNLYDMLRKEKRDKRSAENNSNPVLLFVVFCMENYKSYANIDADRTLYLFKKHGVIEYLEQVFDILHTQSMDYIMDEIERYIHRKMYK